MKLRVHRLATREVLAAVEYYELESAELATRFGLAIRDAYRIIVDNPRLFPLHPRSNARRETRQMLVPRFPYSVIYVVGDDEVIVIAVAHFSRRPDYWRHREAR